MKKIIATITAILMATTPNTANIHTVSGEFHGAPIDCTNADGATETLYQFRSYDNEVWWLLTAEEIGCVPSEGKTYNLKYDDKGTTSCTHSDCECYLYDDVFLGISE